MLGSLLLLIGLASLVRSFFAAGEPIGAIAWKGLLLVTLATVLFGALLRPAGLVIALAAVILVSAAASVRFRFDARALALMGALIVFCGLVFVTGWACRCRCSAPGSPAERPWTWISSPHLALGFSTAASAANLSYCLLGVFLGTAIGVLPGLGPVATIAMLLPVTFGLPPESALIMLAGIFYGAQYGGSTTAILVNLPGSRRRW